MSTKGRELPDGSPCSHKVSEKCHKRGIKAEGELSGLLLDYRPCRLQRHFSCSTPKFFCEGRTPSCLLPSLCPTLSLLCSYRKIKFWVESLVRSAGRYQAGDRHRRRHHHRRRWTSLTSFSSPSLSFSDHYLMVSLSFFPPTEKEERLGDMIK